MLQEGKELSGGKKSANECKTEAESEGMRKKKKEEERGDREDDSKMKVETYDESRRKRREGKGMEEANGEKTGGGRGREVSGMEEEGVDL